jgi:hypothetical protein
MIIIEVETTKFLGLNIDINLNWKAYVQYIMPKLSSPCFCYDSHITDENRNFKISLLCLLSFYHVIGNNFWGSSTDSKKVFYIKKGIIRIMAATKWRASCKEIFKKLIVIPLASEFLLSLLSFIVDNMEKFKLNQISTV